VREADIENRFISDFLGTQLMEKGQKYGRKPTIWLWFAWLNTGRKNNNLQNICHGSFLLFFIENGKVSSGC
jgi:hypothetical protein